LKEAQHEIADRISVEVVTTGNDTLRAIRQEQEYAGRGRPDLVLLDINMPGMGGLEVLQILKADPELRVIPVIMLTTSRHEQDILASYGLGASEYVTKPVTADEFRSKVQAIPVYWSRVVARPPRLHQD
jgi:CheY-like chemotaxis protein